MGVSESMKGLLFYLCICSHVSTVEAWELTLLHTNDVHARVEETSNSYGKCTKPPCFAGVARRFTKIQEIRSREKNVMLLDAGDQFQGTVWFNVYKGAEAAYFMNKLGYDAMCAVNDKMGVSESMKGLLFYLCICSHVSTVEAWELTLLHTNDVHARVEETSNSYGKCTKPPCFAGVARRFTKIQEIRSREKNVMLLDAGDQFQGTVWFNVYKGAEAAYFMNKLGYDAMCAVNDKMGVSESMKGLLFYLCICSHVSTVEAWELTLLHTNDVHARVEETSNSYGKCTKPPCFAGVARRFTKIQEIRSREKNVMLLDAGDQFQGTVWFNVYKGAEAAYFMNKLGYDAMCAVNDKMGVSESMKGLLFYLCICSHVSTVEAWELTLLHTNDVHARVEETSNSYGKCTKPPCFAGVARRFTKIQEIRSREKNVMLLDAGDQFQGTVWFNVYKGAEAAYFMNKLGYDAMALGNHEFDNKVEGLIKPFLQEVKCTVLSANIKADDTLAPHISGLYSPYKIFDVGSQKVAVVGYTSKETPALSQTGPNLVFEDEIDALQPQVDKLITLGVNKIIALGHSGFVTDKEIAKRVKGVDVVIGGHSNTFLYTGEKPSSEVPAGPYPVMVKSEDGREVPVVQAFAFGKYLGYLKVTFDEAGNVVKSTGNPILLDSSVPEDPSILAEVNEWKKALANYSSQYVGETLVYLNGTFEECRFRECNLGNLICDAMVHHNIKYADELQWNHVSSCIVQGGSIRSSIDERSRNGSITMEDLIAVLPFGGTYDLVQLKGSTLKKAFEHSVRRYGGNTGEFLQVSGFHVEYDMSRPPGERARSISVLCSNCRVPVYEPLDDSRLYKVVLPSYLVEGGDGFSMIKEEKLKHDSGDMDISVVASYITERKKVHPAVEGRIKISNSNSGRSGHTTLLILIGLVMALSGSL